MTGEEDASGGTTGERTAGLLRLGGWRYRHTVLVLCLVAFFATMFARLVVSPVVPALTDAFGVSNAGVGFALSGMWAAYALVQFPSGVLADRFGERRVILASMALTAAAGLLLATTPSYPAFVVLVLLLGAGTGLHYSVGTTLVTKLFAGTGRAIGIHVAGAPLAGLVAPLLAAALAVRYGWRSVFVPGAVIASLAFVAMYVAVRPTEPERPGLAMRERFHPSTVLELLSRPPIAFTTLLALLMTFTWQVSASFYPAYLVATRGLSVEAASTLFSLYFVVLGLSQPVTGWASDRLGRDGATALVAVLGVVGFGSLTLIRSLSATVAAVVCTGVAMAWTGPLQSRFMDNLSDAERGTGFGLVRTVYMLVGALGSGAVGWLADTVGWVPAFGLLAVLMGGVVLGLATNRALGLGL